MSSIPLSSNRSNDMSSNHTSSNRSDDTSSATMSSNQAPPPPNRKVGRPRGRPRKYSDCDGIKGNEYRREKDKRDRREKGIKGKKKYPHLDHIKDFKEYRKERDKEDRRLAKEHTDMSELQRQHLEHIEDRNDKEDRQIAKERADISALQRQLQAKEEALQAKEALIQSQRMTIQSQTDIASFTQKNIMAVKQRLLSHAEDKNLDEATRKLFSDLSVSLWIPTTIVSHEQNDTNSSLEGKKADNKDQLVKKLQQEVEDLRNELRVHKKECIDVVNHNSKSLNDTQDIVNQLESQILRLENNLKENGDIFNHNTDVMEKTGDYFSAVIKGMKTEIKKLQQELEDLRNGVHVE